MRNKETCPDCSEISYGQSNLCPYCNNHLEKQNRLILLQQILDNVKSTEILINRLLNDIKNKH